MKLIKIDNARMNVPEPEYYDCANEIAAGELCQLNSSGKLSRNTEFEHNAEFVAMAHGKAGDTIPVCRICKEQVWELYAGGERTGEFCVVGNTVDIKNPYTLGGEKDVEPSGDGVNRTSAVVVYRELKYDEETKNALGALIRVRFLCLYGRDANSGQ